MALPKASAGRARPAPSAALACVLALAGALTGCSRGTVRVPEADPTAPYSALDVVGARERLVLFSGEDPGQVDLASGDSLVLIGLGEDRDGGVKDLVLSGRALAHCVDSLGREGAVKTAAFARRQVQAAVPGRRVAGSRHARYVLKADGFRGACGDGELRAVTGTAGVRAVNYHGQSTRSPTLEFRILPPLLPPPAAGDTLRTASAPSGNRAPRQAESQSPQGTQGPQASRPVFGPFPAEAYPDTPRI